LRAAVDCSIGAQFDFSDLPPEVQDRKERMARIRQLQNRAVRLRLEDVEPGRIVAFARGSPHLSLEEKARLVDELPDLGGAPTGAVRKTEAGRETFGTDVSKRGRRCGRLYEALGTGEMADVYDLESALAPASGKERHWPASLRRRNWIRRMTLGAGRLCASPVPRERDRIWRLHSNVFLACRNGFQRTGTCGSCWPDCLR